MDNSLNIKIKDEIISLIDSKELCSGLTVAFGNEKDCYYYNYGFTGNNNLNVSSDTIIDLASVTKLFLSFAYFHLYDMGLVDFNKPISYYSNRFKNIKDFSISDLMHFNCVLRTKNRITDLSYEQAVNEILNINGEKSDSPLYSDMPAIVLGFLFEEISRTPFGKFVDKHIIEKLNLSNTFWHTNKEFSDFMDYSGEIQILKNRVTELNNPPLIVNDVKARILSNNGDTLCGHSGIFSSANDICKISQALLLGKIISVKSLNKIGYVINTNIEQRFGNLCYCKSPSEYLSEIPPEFSDNAFAMSGFTGNYYCVDPQKQLFIFIGANKLSNRVSKYDKCVQTIDNKIVVDGKKFICSKNFVYEKDILRNACSKYLTT